MKIRLLGYGRRNTTVAAIRQRAALTGSRDGVAAKQPGRSFGPPPKSPPNATAAAPAPLDGLNRLVNYVEQADRERPLTDRQDRQYRRMKTREVYGAKAENRARRRSVTA